MRQLRMGWTARLGVIVMVLGILLSGLGTAFAQEEAVIESTVLGETPTTGTSRPGPAGLEPPGAPIQPGVLPVSIQIQEAFVDAQIETTEIVDGVMLDPTGPWVIAWYKESAKLGQIGNILMAGHVDYWDVGPAVLYNVNNLDQGELIQVTGEDGEIYTYEVDWRENFDANNAPLQEIVGPTENESLTLITCGGPFDYANGVYLQRVVVRAHRVDTPPAA